VKRAHTASALFQYLVFFLSLCKQGPCTINKTEAQTSHDIVVVVAIALRMWHFYSWQKKVIAVHNYFRGVLYNTLGSRRSGERYIGEGRLRLQEVVGSCCVYNTLGAACGKCSLSRIIFKYESMHGQRGRTVPKSSPGRAVKPAARQPAERGQIVSCGCRSVESISTRTRSTPKKRGRRTNCMIIFRRSP
jgi:hypothetical protein